MSRLRCERGIALVTTIVLLAVMLVMGTAILGVVITQANQTTKERRGEAAFNLAEAALNAEAFLLGRNWPKTAVAGTCAANTLTGTLATPPSTPSPTLAQQVQSILAQTYNGSGSPSASQWWVSACAEGGRDSWDASLLNGPAHDSAAPGGGPRRMWVRAEALVDGYKRAVVGLVQAGQAPVFPSKLGVVTGKLGADIRTTANQAVTGDVVAPLLTHLIGGSGNIIDGGVGLRCSLLDQTLLPTCLNGIYKATSMTTVAPLLQANDYVDFRSDTTISAEHIAQLRQEAKTSGRYFANTRAAVGGVAAGASCLPTGSAGKVIFIEQVGDGTEHCILNTIGNPSAKAVVVGAGGIRVCSNATCASASSGGTFTGVLYALHRKAPLTNNWADIRIEGGSKVVGGVFVDDDPALPGSHKRGFVEVIPPPLSISAAIASLPVCQNLLTRALCSLTSVLTGTLDNVISTLGITPATLASALLPQLQANLPALTYDAATVNSVTTLGDSAVVPGTFRQVEAMF